MWTAEALDTLTAIYHRRSAQTHLVASPAPEILGILSDGPLDAVEILAALGRAFDLADPDPDALSVRIDELVATGLVERLDG